MDRTFRDTSIYCLGLYRHFYSIASKNKRYHSDRIFKETCFIIKLCWGFTAFIGVIVGAIVTLQFSSHARQFDIISYLGGMCASGIIREMGPLMIAFMMVGKIGAFTTAELSAMSVTEQLDALEALGVDTLNVIIIPRFIGIVLSGSILLLIGMLFSITGALILGVSYVGLTYEEFLHSMPFFLSISSFVMSLIKCLMFSLAIALISTYESLRFNYGAAGVGHSVVNSSIVTMIFLVILDILVACIFHLLNIVSGF